MACSTSNESVANFILIPKAIEVNVDVEIYDDGVFINNLNWKKLQHNLIELKREVNQYREAADG